MEYHQKLIEEIDWEELLHEIEYNYLHGGEPFDDWIDKWLKFNHSRRAYIPHPILNKIIHCLNEDLYVRVRDHDRPLAVRKLINKLNEHGCIHEAKLIDDHDHHE